MYQFEQPRESFDTTKSPLIIQGRIGNEDKITLRVFNPLNANHSAGAQAGRCADCGSSGCFQGTGPEAVGCPFGRDIPDIHHALDEAGKVLKRAYGVLQKAAPDVVLELEADLRKADEAQSPDLSDENAKFPLRVFEALAKIDPDKAAQLKNLFNKYMKEAFDRSYAKGPMGDIYGRICPGTLCESTCTTYFSNDGAVAIKMNEAALWDYAWVSNWLTPVKPETERPETVVIVGTGFAGYAAAERLRESGYKIVMVDRNEEAGEPGQGQILTYKTNMARFRRHYDRLRQSGVEIVCNASVGEGGSSLSALKERFNASAIVLATGTPVAKKPKLSGNAVNEIVDWNVVTPEQQRIDRRQLTNDDVPPNFNAKGKKVVIIGTGDTAVDCARVAIIQGAKEIVMVSRHDKVKAETEDKAAYDLMRKYAADAGIKFSVQNWMNPTKVLHAADGGYILSGNNRAPEHTNPSLELNANLIAIAVGGETGDLRKTFKIPNLHVSNSGSLMVVPVPERIADKTDKLNVGAGFIGMLDGTPVLAAGQCVREDSLAAVCGRDGVDVAPWTHEAIQDPAKFSGEIHDISGHPALVLNVA